MKNPTTSQPPTTYRVIEKTAPSPLHKADGAVCNLDHAIQTARCGTRADPEGFGGLLGSWVFANEKPQQVAGA